MSAHKPQNPGTGSDPAADVPADATVQTAGAFDIRNFIGTLLALFGLILVGAGIFAFGAEEAAKTDGLNANLWAGLGMLVVGILFVVWTKVDPIRMVVRDNDDGAEEPRDISALD
ncbi:hypothetical protein CFK39_10030 [Brachybacterium avium]|uniref:Uncharacterized protein n=1 Tax=Brachybacterium avium TaxID=2017485 RepID=A0A220UD90_9MICO|nr:tetraspanin family protein [Brachybacterium avium]ASK66097.1 hypothetical protein CFK39_10030 [Brachybacterium avium]